MAHKQTRHRSPPDFRHRSQAAPVDLALGGVSDNAGPMSFECLIQFVQHRCDNRGDRGPPGGVPSAVGLPQPPSSTPAGRTPRLRFHPPFSCHLVPPAVTTQRG
jgi:hypothetical protein